MDLQTLQLIYNKSRPVTAETYKNPYTYLAMKYKIDHYRLISSGELLSIPNVPPHLLKFLEGEPEYLIIFNIVNSLPISAVIRSLRNKEFMDISLKNRFPYNIGNLQGITKRTPLYITEGIKDCDTIKYQLGYPYVIAALSSNIPQFYINLMKSLTNVPMLALDNDEVGRTATNKYIKYHNLGTIHHTNEVKDLGSITDLEFYQPHNEDLDYIRSFYRSQIVL